MIVKYIKRIDDLKKTRITRLYQILMIKQFQKAKDHKLNKKTK